ncbi:TetR family transcriptional regulator [Mycolicibacterium mucogenicum 261Sha1.1M5]|nr:TetR family transcriptional regulator [Mycolicibacterium mucogenicum 261Sha1.1M5]
MDPRAAHTQTLLRTAIVALASDRPITDITVKDIIELAGVNRSSFYQHFESREELLAAALEHIETEMARADEPVVITDPTLPPAELVRFMHHFADHAGLYRGVFGPHGSALVVARVRARILALVRAGILLSPEYRRLTDLPVDIEAAGTSGALLGVIEAWLAQDPLPAPETAANWMWSFLTRMHSQ